jgi:hypothetical protein
MSQLPESRCQLFLLLPLLYHPVCPQCISAIQLKAAVAVHSGICREKEKKKKYGVNGFHIGM